MSPGGSLVMRFLSAGVAGRLASFVCGSMRARLIALGASAWVVPPSNEGLCLNCTSGSNLRFSQPLGNDCAPAPPPGSALTYARAETWSCGLTQGFAVRLHWEASFSACDEGQFVGLLRKGWELAGAALQWYGGTRSFPSLAAVAPFAQNVNWVAIGLSPIAESPTDTP